MKHFSFLLLPYAYPHLLLLLFTLTAMCVVPNRISGLVLGNQTDYLTLLQFKDSISIDPNGVLDSWNSSTHFCNWHGITCSPMHQRVIELNLQGYELHGSISTHIGNLSSLISLSIGYNNLEGNIPKEVCRLKNLTGIIMFHNKLSGTFPSCLFNMSSLTMISAAANHFNGSLPHNMFNTLRNLQTLAIGGNQISGPIPTSITNGSSLTSFVISENYFVGHVPSLGKLQDLWMINVGQNNLGKNSTKDLEFLESLKNCSKLIAVSIAYNNFGGSLPNSIGNLSTQLSQLYLGGNIISGKIPMEIGNLVGLTLLTIELNQLDGIIPSSFGKFQNMQLLDLSRNKLSGVIPTTLGNLSQLYYLGLGENMLQGNIPSSIGNCQKLQSIVLFQNNLSGTIPLEVFRLSSLSILLDLSKNSFSGNLPKEVSMLTTIDTLDVSDNQLSGNISETIGECISLEYLYFQGNSFHGIIPSSLASLRGLRYLDLSRNRLTGSIPSVLQNISVLEYLNVSFNMLDGEVPKEGVFGNASALAVTGNNKLCGGISHLHLPPCRVKRMKKKKHRNFLLMAVIVSVISFVIIMLLIVAIYLRRKRNKKPSSDSPTIDQLPMVSYQDLYQATDGFSDRNLIGSGGFGSVYKGNLMSEDKVIAVKVLNLEKKGAHKSFITECNALKNIRHRNLVKILTCCSSIDNKGLEFKALVFEYMRNGSLEQWLHPGTMNADHPRTLKFEQRLNILVDVSSALHYLHHECEQLVLHCDLKPSNVLIDDDIVAHVSDFGIARLVSSADNNSCQETSTIGIKGTIGYAPPEYGMSSEVSTHGDMYSFGMLILEMLTGRRPTDDMFTDGQNLRLYVEISFPDNIMKILDPCIVPRVEEATIDDGSNRHLISTMDKCFVSIFRIGLACSMESPKERMNIEDATRELNIIRKTFLTGVHPHHKSKLK
ncbi:probable LRR receptor-like serine/threonine-protein kinase At3g47570 isoform X2 [Medicago truncatula]|uniref:non-specific serine/threonine protein kinase n=1 Tax=Medicago truncatula TaxID=3880 RepID=A0A072UEN8_MEDTR|nr:probable LRR receptor-like serine/threonine-protein kinase At3g47570 isoform X2 [Medicago truncatula]KEH27856.1 LRR receptor-like kinase family protein [Medicago truncatula]